MWLERREGTIRLTLPNQCVCVCVCMQEKIFCVAKTKKDTVEWTKTAGTAVCVSKTAEKIRWKQNMKRRGYFVSSGEGGFVNNYTRVFGFWPLWGFVSQYNIFADIPDLFKPKSFRRLNLVYVPVTLVDQTFVAHFLCDCTTYNCSRIVTKTEIKLKTND